MVRFSESEGGRWALPAVAMLIVFLLYTSVAVIAVVASGGPALVAAAADGTRGLDETEESDGLDQEREETAAPTTEPTPAVTPSAPPAPDPRLPASCEALFSASVVDAANNAGLVLNPSWSVGTAPGGLALQDADLAATLSGLPSLDCRWLSPNGGSDVGIRSVVAVVTYDQALALDSRFAGLGYTAQNELGGTRYFFEANAGGVPYGESHIVRGDLWFATHWLSYGPRGYTADMVNNHFG